MYLNEMILHLANTEIDSSILPACEMYHEARTIRSAYQSSPMSLPS